jgi:hypothetical protein
MSCVIAATACLPVDFRPTQFGRARTMRSPHLEREFLERVAHAESLNDVTVAAHIALHGLGDSRAA